MFMLMFRLKVQLVKYDPLTSALDKFMVIRMKSILRGFLPSVYYSREYMIINTNRVIQLTDL